MFFPYLERIYCFICLMGVTLNQRILQKCLVLSHNAVRTIRIASPARLVFWGGITAIGMAKAELEAEQERSSDYETKALDNVQLQPNESANGVVFFGITNKTPHFTNARLSVSGEIANVESATQVI